MADPSGGRAPEIAVCVASHARPLRLRWLLNALEEQSLDRARFEVVVAHDSGPASETERVLDGHPLAAAGVLRHVTLATPRGPAELRNLAWRASRAPVVAFTDDDCRPPAGWLAGALDAARRHPGAIVQGATRPDPDEAALLRTPHPRSQLVEPPSVWAQACNIVYPRAALEQVGGFDDDALPLFAGEDTDLAWRARQAGFAYVGAPEVLTFHAVETLGLVRRAAFGWRWRQMAALFARHPGLRRHAVLRIFWKPRHALLLLAAGGLAAARRSPPAAVAALPWARAALPSYGTGPRGRIRALAELPGQAAIDTVEVAALAAGSVRHRTLLL